MGAKKGRNDWIEKLSSWGGRSGARAASLIVLSLLSCDSATAPQVPALVSQERAVRQPPDLPQEIVARPFDFENLRGFSAFALVGRSREERIALMLEGRAHGFPTVRACGETEYWDGAPDDDHPRFPRDLQKLQEFLDDAARIEGIQVLLVPNCTLRDAVPVAEQLAWDKQVRELVVRLRYPNIAVEVVNEFWHPDSLIGKQPVVAMVAAWNAAGVAAGSDDHVCLGDFTLQHRLYGHAAFYSFHPCRTVPVNPRIGPWIPWDPDYHWLQRLRGANGSRPLLLSETVCYADPNEYGGLCTDDKARVQEALAAAKQAGIGWIYHSREGLRAKPPYAWWPSAR